MRRRDGAIHVLAAPGAIKAKPFEGVAGATARETAFLARLLAEIGGSRVDVIVTYKTDRLTRLHAPARHDNRLDFALGQSVHAQSRPRQGLNLRAATALAGIAGRASGGDGANPAPDTAGVSDEAVSQSSPGQERRAKEAIARTRQQNRRAAKG